MSERDLPLVFRLRDSGWCDAPAARAYMAEAADEIERLSQRRRVLPNKRRLELYDLAFRGRDYAISVGRYEDGGLAEIFIDAKKASTDASDDARAAALVLSLALQHGCPAETIRNAVTRDFHGRPADIVGAVLDALAETEGATCSV
ncbi:hypothetical protein [Methylosinus sp. LW4]|uniref:hypothetical protein n=1 Tax=Methylosinus sp. LW4 TaxID=136993 RepID=UPI00037D7693|nr:hypothetical protein [Methylosinus sp. LW4]